MNHREGNLRKKQDFGLGNVLLNVEMSFSFLHQITQWLEIEASYLPGKRLPIFDSRGQ